jgi:hypothetical protein
MSPHTGTLVVPLVLSSVVPVVSTVVSPVVVTVTDTAVGSDVLVDSSPVDVEPELVGTSVMNVVTGGSVVMFPVLDSALVASSRGGSV